MAPLTKQSLSGAGQSTGAKRPSFFVAVPVRSAISKRLCRYISQEVCPWNVRFARENRVPEFTPREFLTNKNACELSQDLLAMSPEEFSAAFKGSPMKRAKLRGLKRHAAVLLGNVGTDGDIDVLERALDDPQPLVREHAAWALARLRGGAISPERSRR